MQKKSLWKNGYSRKSESTPGTDKLARKSKKKSKTDEVKTFEKTGRRDYREKNRAIHVFIGDDPDEKRWLQRKYEKIKKKRKENGGERTSFRYETAMGKEVRISQKNKKKQTTTRPHTTQTSSGNWHETRKGPNLFPKMGEKKIGKGARVATGVTIFKGKAKMMSSRRKKLIKKKRMEKVHPVGVGESDLIP